MSSQPAQLRPRARRGFSLIEVLVLVVVIGIVGAAAGRTLQMVAATPVQNDRMFQIETQLISKMEYLRSLPFDSIAVGSPNSMLSDNVTIAGTYHPRLVNVTLADGDGNGSVDSDFKQITVTCGSQSVSTLIAR